MKFSVEIVARGASLSRIREIYFSQAFESAVARAANLVERTQVEQAVQPDGKERTRTRVVPRVGLPGAVEKLLQGQAIRYDEVVVFDPATSTADFSIRSLAGKTVQVNGKIRFIEAGSDVRLAFDGEARIHVFGVGGMLERFLVSEVTQRYARVQDVLQGFVDGRGATPA